MELKSKITKFKRKNICRTCLKVDPNSEIIYDIANEQILKELRSFVNVEVCFYFLFTLFLN